MRASIRNTEIYFDIAGMQLAFTKEGALVEKPVVFLLHGGPGSDHTRFKQHTLPLQDVAQLVFIDHRGCGRSRKGDPSEYTLDNNIEDIEALRQHLGLNKICILGASYGGMVAQGYAIRYGEYLDKLVLVATSPSYRSLDKAKLNLKKYGNSEQIAISEHLWKGSFASNEHLETFFRIMEPLYSVAAKIGKKKVFQTSKTTWSYEVLNKGFSDFLKTVDFIPDLHKISCPTLILAGDSDWIKPPEQSQIIANHIPNSQLKVFKNCGHAIATDANEQYIEAIKNFIEKSLDKFSE